MADINITVASDGIDEAKRKGDALVSTYNNIDNSMEKLGKTSEESARKMAVAGAALVDFLNEQARGYYEDRAAAQARSDQQMIFASASLADKLSEINRQSAADHAAQRDKQYQESIAQQQKIMDAAVAAYNKQYEQALAMDAAFNAKKAKQLQDQIEKEDVLKMNQRAREAAEAEKAAKKAEQIAAQQAAASAKAFEAIGPTRANLDAATQAGEKWLANLKAQTDTIGMTAQQLRAYQAEVMRTQAAQKGVSEAAEGMIKKFEEAPVHAGHAAGGVAGITRELLVLGHEISQGQFNRFGGSMIVLAERIDLTNGAAGALSKVWAGMTPILSLLINPLTVVGALLAGGLVTWYSSVSAVHEFNKELILTGNYAGTTGNSLYTMSDAVGKAYGNIGKAREAAEALTASGKFTADQIENITKAAVGLYTYGGVAIDKTIAQFETLSKESLTGLERSYNQVSKAAMELDQQMHFLEPSTLKAIIDQENLKNMHEASSIAIKALSEVEQQRAKDLYDNLTGLGKVAHDVSAAFTNMWNSLWTKKSPQQELAGVREALKELSDPDSARSRLSVNPEKMKQDLLKRSAELQNQVLAEQNKAEEEAAKKQENREINAALIYNRELDNRLKGLNKFQQAYDAYMQQQAALEGTAFQRTKEQREADIALLHKENDEKVAKDNREQTSEVQRAVAAQVNLARIAKDAMDNQNRQLDEAYKHGDATIEEHYDARRKSLVDYEKVLIDSLHKQVQLEEAALSGGVYEKASQRTDARARIDSMKASLMKASQDLASGLELLNQKEVNDTTVYYDNLAEKAQKADNVVIDGLNKTLKAQKQHTAEIGLTKEAIEALRAVQAEASAQELDTQIAAYQLAIDKGLVIGREAEIYQNHLNELKRQAKEIREISAEQQTASSKEAALALQKEVDKSWKDTNRKIGDDLAAAIVDGGGKGWKKLLRDMEIAFAKAVLQPILAPISGGFASLLNPTATQAGGAVGGANSPMGILSAATNIYSMLSNGFAGSMGAVGNGITSVGNFLGFSGAGALGSGFGAGAGIANSGMAFADQLAMAQMGGGVGSLGAYAGMGASYAGGLGIGHTVGNAIAGDYSIGNHGQAVTNIASVIGAALGGPIGGAIGGAVGGLVNRLFGMGSKDTTAQGIRGTIADTGVTGESYLSWYQKGGLFRSDKSGTDTKALTADITNSFQSGLVSMKAASSEFAKNINVSADSLKDYSKAFDIALTNDATKNQQAITDFFTTMGDDMATKLVPNIADFAKSGESASTTLQRLSSVFSATNQIAAMLGKSVESVFGGTGLSSDAVRERLVDLAGGLDKLVSKTTAYASAFLTDAEKLAPVQKALSDAMTSLGYGSITTKDQFKALVNSLNLTDESQAKLFNSLMDLAPAFAQVTDASEAAAKAAKDLADQQAKDAADLYSKRLAMQIEIAQLEGRTLDAAKLTTEQRKLEIAAMDASLQPLQARINQLNDDKAARDTAMSMAENALSRLKASVDAQKQIVTDAYAKQIQAAKDATAAELKAANDAKTAINSVFTSISSALKTTISNSFVLTSQNRAEAVQTLQEALRSGNMQGKDLQSALDNISKPSEALYSSFEDYARDQAKNTNLLTDLQSAAQSQVDQAQATIDAITQKGDATVAALEASRDAQLAALDNIYNQASAQLDALKGVDNSVLSLAAALAGFKGAAAGVVGTTTQQTQGTGAAIQGLYSSLLGRQADAGGLAFYTNAFMNGGASIADIAADIAKSAEYKSLHPSLAVGTNFLPSDMTINAHAGERIIPAADNAEIIRRLDGGNTSNEEVVAAINSLKETIRAGDISNVQLNQQMYRLWKKFDQDGMPEVRDVSAIGG